jgi:hypothetical protein
MEIADKTTCTDILREKRTARCPYRNALMNICTASLFHMQINAQQLSACCSADGFGDCALFLSKTLRGK